MKIIGKRPVDNQRTPSNRDFPTGFTERLRISNTYGEPYFKSYQKSRTGSNLL